MRTLMVSNDFPPQVGGIQVFADEILRRLDGAAAFVADHPDAAEHDAGAPYAVLRGPSRFMLPGRTAERALRQAVRDTGADVLLFAAPWPLPPLGPRVGVPFAVVAHGAELIMPSRIPGLAALLRRHLRRADLLLAVSEHTAGHLRRLVGRDGPPIRLLRNGVTLDAFDPDDDGAEIRARHDLGDDPVVVCVGRLVARKGQDVLVEAWPQVRAAVPDARLVIVGDGKIRDDLAEAAAAQPAGAVTLAGRVPAEDLPRYLAAADLFAHPNRSRWLGLETEGFGVVFLEAQAAGRAVVAGDSGGSPEAILPGRTGELVDGSDVDAVAATIVGLLRDDDRRRAMGAAGRRFVEATYDWDVIVDRLAGELAAVASGSPPPSAV